MKGQGTFYGKGIKTQSQAFLKADDDIKLAFSQFRESLEIPEDLVVQMQKYICLLYLKKAGKNIKGNLIVSYYESAFLRAAIFIILWW